MTSTDSPLGYSKTAQTYWEKGWIGVLPLAARKKYPPPKGTTGYDGLDPSFADVTAWTEDFPDGNVCLRMPEGVIGIDVDAYGAKGGDRTLIEAQKRWGPLPGAPISTSRDDGVSGIRMFRVPGDVPLSESISFPELSLGDIEIIQRHHRYAVVWPSVHPEGRPYWWTNSDGQLIGIPAPSELPMLPQSWVEGLRITRRALLIEDWSEIDITRALTEGAPAPAVQERLVQAIRELNLPGCSRHDTCCRHVMALARLGMNDLPGVGYALTQLRQVFVAVVAVDGSRTEEEAVREFNRMFSNPNMARELAQPGITDWMKNLLGGGPDAKIALDAGLLTPEPAPEPPFRIEAVPDEEPEPGGAGGPDADIANMGGASAGAAPSSPEPGDQDDEQGDPNPPRLEELEQDFWTARPELELVFTAALSRMASPWAVLACCVARALSLVPPTVVLPPVIGGVGSLNWFGVIAAKSGGGKGAAMAVARGLVPGDILMAGIGSGEGMIERFNRGKGDDDGEEISSVLFNIEEIDSLGSITGRSGQTTMAILRQGFSGEQLGFSYRGRAGEVVREQSYRMTVIAAVQPERAGVLLDDSGGGTPQRFMWFPGRDRRITADAPEWPLDSLGDYQVIPLPSQRDLRPGPVAIPDEARDEIIAARVRSMTGEGDDDPLESHRLFAREKFAFALAFLNGRAEIDGEDWRLAGIASDVSTWMRLKAAEAYRRGKEEASREIGHQRGLAADEQRITETRSREDHVERVAKWIVKRLRTQRGGHTQGALRKAMASRDRVRLIDGLTIAQGWGLIYLADGKWYAA